MLPNLLAHGSRCLMPMPIHAHAQPEDGEPAARSLSACTRYTWSVYLSVIRPATGYARQAGLYSLTKCTLWVGCMMEPAKTSGEPTHRVFCMSILMWATRDLGFAHSSQVGAGRL